METLPALTTQVVRISSLRPEWEPRGPHLTAAAHRFGFTEVSGVCTHPDWRGRGYAALLSRVVAARIMARGETPMLHAFIANTAAIRLYEQLGFTARSQLHGVVFRRA